MRIRCCALLSCVTAHVDIWEEQCLCTVLAARLTVGLGMIPTSLPQTVRFVGVEEHEPEVRKRRGSLKEMLHRRRKRSKEEKEEYPPVSFKELLKLNVPDWPFVLVGVLASGMIGAMFPLMAILFSDVLEVDPGKTLTS